MADEDKVAVPDTPTVVDQVASDDDDKSKLNPLTVDLVLTRLFEHLPVPDLANCRLVSWQWYSESLPKWRSTSTVKFLRAEDDEIYVRKRDKSFIKVSPVDFLHSWEGCCPSYPYEKFYLKSWRWNSIEANSFWQRVGAHVTTLTLSCNVFENVGEFRKVMYQACPLLQSLIMRDCFVNDTAYSVWRYYQYDGELGGEHEEYPYKKPTFGEHAHLKSLTLENCIPDSWLEILSHFSSLNSLRFFSEEVTTFTLLKMLEAIKIIREENPMNLPLGHFSIHFQLEGGTEEDPSYASFRLLRELRLPVKNFTLSLNDEMDPNVIKSIVQQHSNTLSKFEAWQQGSHPSEFPFGVELPNLKWVSINKPNFCYNMHFLKCMPKLQKLEVYSILRLRQAMGDLSHLIELDPYRGLNPFTNTCESDMAGVRLRRLTELRLQFEVTEGNVRSLVKWMPNMRILELHLDDRKFAIVSAKWKKLIELTDIGNTLSDEGVIGGVEGKISGEGKGQPNITKLQRLKVFETRSGNLTGASALHGFSKLPFLKRLVFHERSSHNRFRRDTKGALQGKGIKLRFMYLPRDRDVADSTISSDYVCDMQISDPARV